MVKKSLRILSIFLIFTMIFLTSSFKAYSEKEAKDITLVFTHDLHDHLYPSDVEEDGEIKTLGGYARLYTAIQEERGKDSNLLLVDGGDSAMGTLFQTIFDTDAPALRMLGQMGYDVTTFGNHEFDFRASGLAKSLKAAVDSGDSLPQIVASNVFFPEVGEDTEAGLGELKASMKTYGVKDYIIIQRNGIRIGIFGLMGKEAASNAPMAGVEFKDPIDSAKGIVSKLKGEEETDLIICLSHSGTWEDKSKSEDEILAKEVPDIDIIISGHTHTALHEPILVGNTIIGSSGRYGDNLGVLNISLANDRWKLNRYELKPIDDSFQMDKSILQSIEDYKGIVQDKYLDRFNMTFDEIVAYTPFDFTSYARLGQAHDEDILGNLISDSYIYAVKEAEGENYEPIAAAVVPNGTIRGSFVKGNIRVSDVFNVSSLGIGADKISGYPLISVYLTGKELRTVAEVDASIAPIMSVAQLYMSGLNYTFNPNRLIFNKVIDAYLEREDGTREEIDNDKLYRVIAGLYSAQMLSIVGDQSYGLLSIVPKDREGNPIVDFENQIIHKGNHEIKEWLAIAEYLKSFDEGDGIPVVSQYYSQKQGRKIIEDDKDIIARVKKPNKIALGLYGIILTFLTIIALLVRYIVRRKKRIYAK